MSRWVGTPRHPSPDVWRSDKARDAEMPVGILLRRAFKSSEIRRSNKVPCRPWMAHGPSIHLAQTLFPDSSFILVTKTRASINLYIWLFLPNILLSALHHVSSLDYRVGDPLLVVSYRPAVDTSVLFFLRSSFHYDITTEHSTPVPLWQALPKKIDRDQAPS